MDITSLLNWYKKQDTPFSAYLRGDNVADALSRNVDKVGSLLQTPEGALDLVNPMAKVAGLLGTVKNMATQKKAIDTFGITKNPKETGFILDDGRKLDFSGRHYASGYKKEGDKFVPSQKTISGKTDDYLANNRTVDHRQASSEIGGDSSLWEDLIKFQDDTGAVRYYDNVGASLADTNKPSVKQIETLIDDFKYKDYPLNIDIDTSSGYSKASKEFKNPDIFSVMEWMVDLDLEQDLLL